MFDLVPRFWSRRARRGKPQPAVRPRGLQLESLECRTVPSARVGLDLAPGSPQPHGEIEVGSFRWDVDTLPVPGSGGGANKPQFGDFEVTVDPSVADPGLLLAVATGKHVPSVVLHVRSGEPAAREFQTYTFSDVVFTAYHTEAAASRLSFRFGKVQEVEQTHTGTVSASLDLKAGTSSAAVPPGGVPQPAAAKQLSLAGIGNGLAVDAFAFGATNSAGSGSGGGAGKPTAQDFSVTLRPTALDPVLLRAVVTGQHLPQATLTVATHTGGKPFQTYTFQDVALTSYHTENGEVVLTLHAGEVQEDETTPAGTVSARLDLKAGTSSVTLPPGGVPQPPAAKQLTLTGVGTGLTVNSFSFGATQTASGAGGGGTGKASVEDFTVQLAPTALDPVLLQTLFTGKHLTQATLTVAANAGTQPFQTYTLTDVTVTSYRTDGQTVFLSLHFGKVQEVEVTPAGAVSASVDVKTGVSTVAVPPGGVTTPASARQLSLAGIGTGLAVDAFTLGATNTPGVGGVSKASFQDVSVSLRPTALDPVLLQTLFTGKHLTQATLTVAAKAGARPSQTYTFQDVVITSYHTEDGAVVLTLRFGRVQETETTPTGTVRASIDLLAQTSSVSLPPGGVTQPPAAKQLSLAGIGSGLAVDAFDFGATNSAGTGSGGGGGAGKPSFQDFGVTLRPTALDPVLLQTLFTGKHLTQATLTVAAKAGARPSQTYTFQDVVITSYSSADGVVRLTLRFSQVQETAVTSAGTVSASLDLKTGTSNAVVPPGGVPHDPSAEQLSLTGIGTGLAAESFSWGVSNSAGTSSGGGTGKAAFEDFSVALAPTALDPALLQRLATGQHLPQVTFTVATHTGAQPFRTFTLTDVTLTSYATHDGHVVLTFQAAAVKEEFRPFRPDGTLGATASASFNLKTNTGTGSLTLPAVPDSHAVSPVLT